MCSGNIEVSRINFNHAFYGTAQEADYPIQKQKCTEIQTSYIIYEHRKRFKERKIGFLSISWDSRYEIVPVTKTRYETVCTPAQIKYNEVLEDHHFLHSVHSSDPSTNHVFIWTRITPLFQDEYGRENHRYSEHELNALKHQYESVTIKWAIAETDDIDLLSNNNKNLIDYGFVQTSSDVDYTVKVMAQNLKPNKRYYYRFAAGKKQSDIGSAYTLPAGNEAINELTFATGSCLMWSHSFYTNASDITRNCQNCRFMLFLGDMIYEFPNDKYVNGSDIGRTPHPDKLTYELEDYRGRYRQLNTDSHFQSLRKQTTFISIYDDHELCDNYWCNGAPQKKHDDNIMPFLQRKMNAYRAYFEWNAVKPPIDLNLKEENMRGFNGLYRNFKFGELMELIVIDTRSQRTKPAKSVFESESLPLSDHYMLGPVQREWLIQKMSKSTAKWIVIGNPGGSFGYSPPHENKLIFEHELYGVDKWEGYYAEMQYIIHKGIIGNNLKNVIFLSGGPHTAAAQHIFAGKPDPYSSPVAVEFIVDAMAAPKLGEEKYNNSVSLEKYANYWSWVSPYIKFGVDGYSVVKVTHNVFKIEFWINANAKDPTTHSTLHATFCVESLSNKISDCNGHQSAHT